MWNRTFREAAGKDQWAWSSAMLQLCFCKQGLTFGPGHPGNTGKNQYGTLCEGKILVSIWLLQHTGRYHVSRHLKLKFFPCPRGSKIHRQFFISPSDFGALFFSPLIWYQEHILLLWLGYSMANNPVKWGRGWGDPSPHITYTRIN